MNDFHSVTVGEGGVEEVYSFIFIIIILFISPFPYLGLKLEEERIKKSWFILLISIFFVKSSK